MDDDSFVLWFEYAGDEISVIAWPQMSVQTLTERSVEILVDRRVFVMLEQILLHHEGMTLDAKALL